jgi:hypothetical protein
MYVAWLDDFDFVLSRDLSSFREADLEGPPDSLELGLSGRSLRDDSGVSDLCFCAEMSVSGGVGGLVSFFFDDEDLRLAEKSADLERFFSSWPRSVGSGVSGSVRLAADTSSRLRMASLLCALLKDG